MDIGAEISKKIQMAITAKLKELDAYVDDELPDYIMIMVANKKTEAQMTEALSLFLSNNTKAFTSWLHNLLSSLRKGKGDRKQSESSKNEVLQSGELLPRPGTNTDEDHHIKKKLRMSNSSESKVPQISSQPSHDKVPSEAIISIDHEMHDVFDEELLAESSAAELLFSNKLDDGLQQVRPPTDSSSKKAIRKSTDKSSHKSVKSSKELKRKSSELGSSQDSAKTKKEKPSSKTTHEKSGKQERKSAKVSRKSSKSVSTNKVEKPVREWDRGKTGAISNESKTSSWHEMSRREKSFYSDSEGEDKELPKTVLSSTVSQIPQDPEFVSDSDSDDDAKLKISSRVAYPKRKTRVPLAKQANKALFMKAVNAAEKSVNTSKATVVRRETSPKFAKTEKRMRKSTSSKGESQNIKSKEIPDNDVRRKLEIRRAVGQVLCHELLGESKRGNLRAGINNSNATKSKQQRASKTNEQIVDHTVQKPNARKTERSLEQNNLPPSHKKATKIGFVTDQRKFIVQDVERSSVENTTMVTSNSNGQPTGIDTEEIQPHKTATQELSSASTAESMKTQDVSGKAPNFIVTLDGVIRSKHTVELSEEEKKAARLQKFKFEKVSSGPSHQTGNRTDSLTKDVHYEETSAMSQLQKMEEKILEVQKESTRLKQMQVKLASIHAGQVQTTTGTDSDSGAKSGDGQKSIFIANVHYSTSEKQLCDYFSICGKISRATILKDSVTGHPKGFAYLEFEDKHAVSSALALNNTQLNNRVIRVTIKQPTTAPIPYHPTRNFRANYRGRASRSFHPRFRSSRFTRFRNPQVMARNKTWVNPALTELTK